LRRRQLALPQSGVNGLVVPERDSVALPDKIGYILANPTLQKQLSSSARRIVAEWDNKRMVRGFQEAIEYA
jgi:glycosyltransferase involved in cell wall biosynthesis